MIYLMLYDLHTFEAISIDIDRLRYANTKPFNIWNKIFSYYSLRGLKTKPETSSPVNVNDPTSF